MDLFVKNKFRQVLILQLPNDRARVYTEDLIPGKYSIEFWLHAKGPGTGGLNVYTRSNDTMFAQLVWYYSGRVNGTFDQWTKVQVEVNQETSFQVR